MVDNENQWEDMEYSDEADASGDYSDENYDDEYSEQEEYESYEEEDDDDEGGGSSQPQKMNFAGCLVILVLLGAIVAGAVMFLLPKLRGDSGMPPAAPVQQAEQMTVPPVDPNQGQVSDAPVGEQQNAAEVGDMFFNEAGGESTEMMSVDFNEAGQANVATGSGEDEIVATVTEESLEPAANQTTTTTDDLFAQEDTLTATPDEGNSDIMVSYSKTGRENPFKPPVEIEPGSDGYEMVGDEQFEIIEPPLDSVADENLTKLLQTQISGILYDEESPSAIVNLNGMDQFVKAGDTISGYTIDYITRDKVQISYQNNSYVASVGELFTRGKLEKQRAVVNLESKFAGRYKNNQ